MAIVMEMGSEVVALASVEWVFPTITPMDKAWLTYSNKWDALKAGDIRFAFVTDERRRSAPCYAAVAAFRGLGVQGTGALWGRVDMRVDRRNRPCLLSRAQPCPQFSIPRMTD